MSLTLPEIKTLFEDELAKSLQRPPSGQWSSKRLYDCMRYTLSSPGKRLRPLMVLSSALAVAKDKAKERVLRQAMPAALAIEYVHTYSLIHDDLPAMDNDDFRRGRLSAHRQFDEALAILAGDALLADAFWWALSSPNNPASIARELARASGSRALVAGQAEDLNSYDGVRDVTQWLAINSAKTARLFEASAVMGGLSQEAIGDELEALRAFGQAFGMAFQIKDDMDDCQGLHEQTSLTELGVLKSKALEKAYGLAQILHRGKQISELFHLTFAT